MNTQTALKITFPSELLRTAQGLIAAASFSLLLAGTNLTTPLIPLYKNVLGFTPFLMSLTFVCYVGILIGVLLALAKPSVVRWSPYFICAALSMAILSDLLLGTATESGILAGRAIAGIAGGLGTGAAAALVVAALGVKGRSLSATGNLVGAVLGTSLSQWCVNHLGEISMHLVFYIHAVASSVLLILLAMVLICNRNTNQNILTHRKSQNTAIKFSAFDYLVPIGVGCVSWIAISTAIVFLPSFFDSLHMMAASRYGVIVMLVFCAAGQLGSPWLTGKMPSASGIISLLAGVFLIILSGVIRSSETAIIAFGIIGLGVGISYRLCLIMITLGVSASEHGARSSYYAAVTYCAAALVILLAGMLGNFVGLIEIVYLLFFVILVSCSLFFFKAPRLKDAIEVHKVN
ncbi:MFS transporter [Brenneria sp. g21c3]|uniref:MFS transporter n=1 Tax=Brenneria sp. g21c3 TaxID=3093893 RepID=UPI002E982C27|nr:MFS transporter [Brenneria sp. g21c3]